ncbi:MAG: hypothetical protein WC436_01455 [Candidatus Babeliales bacterium]
MRKRTKIILLFGLIFGLLNTQTQVQAAAQPPKRIQIAKGRFAFFKNIFGARKIQKRVNDPNLRKNAEARVLADPKNQETLKKSNFISRFFKKRSLVDKEVIRTAIPTGAAERGSMRIEGAPGTPQIPTALKGLTFQKKPAPPLPPSKRKITDISEDKKAEQPAAKRQKTDISKGWEKIEKITIPTPPPSREEKLAPTPPPSRFEEIPPKIIKKGPPPMPPAKKVQKPAAPVISETPVVLPTPPVTPAKKVIRIPITRKTLPSIRPSGVIPQAPPLPTTPETPKAGLIPVAPPLPTPEEMAKIQGQQKKAAKMAGEWAAEQVAKGKDIKIESPAQKASFLKDIESGAFKLKKTSIPEKKQATPIIQRPTTPIEEIKTGGFKLRRVSPEEQRITDMTPGAATKSKQPEAIKPGAPKTAAQELAERLKKIRTATQGEEEEY